MTNNKQQKGKSMITPSTKFSIHPVLDERLTVVMDLDYVPDLKPEVITADIAQMIGGRDGAGDAGLDLYLEIREHDSYVGRLLYAHEDDWEVEGSLEDVVQAIHQKSALIQIESGE